MVKRPRFRARRIFATPNFVIIIINRIFPNRLACLLIVLILTSGCGPSPEIMAKQDEQRRAEYEQQKKNPAGLSPREKKIRQERLELEYGDLISK